MESSRLCLLEWSAWSLSQLKVCWFTTKTAFSFYLCIVKQKPSLNDCLAHPLTLLRLKLYFDYEADIWNTMIFGRKVLSINTVIQSR